METLMSLELNRNSYSQSALLLHPRSIQAPVSSSSKLSDLGVATAGWIYGRVAFPEIRVGQSDILTGMHTINIVVSL